MATTATLTRSRSESYNPTSLANLVRGNQRQDGSPAKLNRQERRIRAGIIVPPTEEEKQISSAHAAAARKVIRDHAALLSFECLESITPAKIRKMSAKELVDMAEKAYKMAGIAAPSAKETYFKSMSLYLKKKSEEKRVPRTINAKPIPQDIVSEPLAAKEKPVAVTSAGPEPTE